MIRTIYPQIEQNIERALGLIEELGELADEVVVAGGAAIGLLITDPANPFYSLIFPLHPCTLSPFL